MQSAVNSVLRRVPVWAVWCLGLVPLAILIAQAVLNALGPDPVSTLQRELGEWGLKLLLLTLAVSPLRRFTGISLIRFRRALGLLTFTYVALHLAVWVSLDLAFRWAEIGADLVKRPYIIVGMIGFLVMLPLALTSNNASVRWLGPQGWQRLHRLTYAAVIAGAAHFVMLSKVWTGEALVYALVAAVLLGLRLIPRLPRRAEQTA